MMNHGVKVIIGELEIAADSYNPVPKENAVQFYCNKSSLDYVPPIKVDINTLSDFGNKTLLIESEKYEQRKADTGM